MVESKNVTFSVPTTSALWTVFFGTSIVSPGSSITVFPYMVNLLKLKNADVKLTLISLLCYILQVIRIFRNNCCFLTLCFFFFCPHRNFPDIMASFFDTLCVWSGKSVLGVNVYCVQLYPCKIKDIIWIKSKMIEFMNFMRRLWLSWNRDFFSIYLAIYHKWGKQTWDFNFFLIFSAFNFPSKASFQCSIFKSSDMWYRMR